MSSTETESVPSRPSDAVQFGLVAVAILVFLYSFLVLAQPLLGLAVVGLLVGLYLVWRFFHLASRFVRAVERIADSMETRNEKR